MLRQFAYTFITLLDSDQIMIKKYHLIKHYEKALYIKQDHLEVHSRLNKYQNLRSRSLVNLSFTEKGETLGYNWIKTDIDSVRSCQNIIPKIFSKKIDGIQIANFLSREECLHTYSNIQNHRELLSEVSFGALLGYPLNGGNYDRTRYFQLAKKYEKINKSIFGFNIVEKLKNIFESLSPGKLATPPIENGHAYTPGTFRVMTPLSGGLKAHTGNEFINLHREDGLSYLLEISHLYNSMSYFIVIHEPDEGGNLNLYKLLWENTPESHKGFSGNQRDDSIFEQYEKVRIKPVIGDLIIFAGGRIWHKVDDILGQANRVTFGGFLAISKNENKVFYWG